VRVISLGERDADYALARALIALDKGEVIAFPTETFYALGARFDRPDALEKLFEIKGRPSEKPVSLIVSGAEALSFVAEPPGPLALKLMERFWPGPVTFVLMAVEGLSEFITSMGKVAIRVPGKSFALDLAMAAGYPITATSANPSGKPPARDAGAVKEYFPGGVSLLIDGGRAPGGLPSTVLDVTGEGVKILRHGAAIIEPKDFETA